MYKYDGGPKSMTVIGFIPVLKLPRNMVLGDGCMAFQPVDDDEVRESDFAQRLLTKI